MQMFVLDADPAKSASYLCDAHVRVIGREVTMQLSSWYWWNVPECRHMLPYKPMSNNQPLVLQLNSIPVRSWAIGNAGYVFDEFAMRFGKSHASEDKYWQLIDAIMTYDRCVDIGQFPVRFTFVAKGEGVFPGKTMSQAVKLYRDYYRRKMDNMKVPVKWTGIARPCWI